MMRRFAVTVACAALVAALGAAPAGAAKTQLRLHTAAPDGFIFPGDSVFVNAYVFLPKLVCGKKAKFWMTDGDGKVHRLGRRRPKYTFDPRGQVYKPLRDLPRDAAPGRGWFKSRHKCTPLGQTVKISGRQRITIVDPSANPQIENVNAPDGFTAERFNMRFSLTDQSRVEAWIEYELTPGRWEQVDSLTEKAFYRKKGNYTLRWGGKVAGERVPPGHYRFAIRTRALDLFSAGRGPIMTDDFFVIQALAEGQFTAPIDAEAAPGDRILVADGAGNRLQVIRFDGSVAQSVGGLGTPQDVAVSETNVWYVAESDNRRVLMLNGSGAPIGSFGQDRFDGSVGPQGIAYSAVYGQVYVVDTGEDIEIFDRSGSFLAPWGSGLSDPRAIDVGIDGHLFVKEAESIARVSWDDGSLLGRFPVERPLSVSVDPTGRVLVGDGGTSAVRVFDSSGALLASLGQGLAGSQPKGIATAGAAGDFFLVDAAEKRLLRFRLP